MMRLVALLIVLIVGVASPGCDARKEAGPAAKPAATKPRAALIDINSANEKDLMTLKGIGEVRAAAIVRGRPFARKDELVQRGIVPYAVYDGIKDQIIARQK